LVARPLHVRTFRALLLSVIALFVATCTDQPTTPTSGSGPASPPPPLGLADVTSGPVVLVGAGNIARCDRTGDEQTALLLDGIAGTVFTAGDNIWASGTLADYQSCYNPTWGRHKSRTRPAAGDLDYQTVGAAGYYQYFGAAAGDSGKGYYSYDLGEWHIVVLNSSISMTATSPQVTWLKADLAANPRQCSLAYWDLPRFSSRGTAVRAAVKPLWDALYAGGAELILNTHYRVYERFAPQNPAGALDTDLGIRQFIVGTGGHVTQSFGSVVPNSEARIGGVFGVLKLSLDAGAYGWEFVPVAGQTASESGSGTCHRRPGEPAQNLPPTARPGGPYAGEASVTFNGSASTDPDNNVPLTYAWDFGDGATGTGVAPSKTYAADGSYTVTLVVTDALGLASAPATATATIGNLPPAVNAGADAAVDLGTAFFLNATFTDPGGGGDTPWSWSITWGDGNTETGSTPTLGGPITASHTYGAVGQFTVAVTVTDKDGGAGSDNAIVTVTDPNAAAVLVGAGDIAVCGSSGDEQTAALLDGITGTVITLGDNVYANGTPTEFANCYNPSWGRHKARTKPVAGNHDYYTTNAAGYFGYFGAAAGDPTKGYYSYDAGPWHVIVLNSGSEDPAQTAAGSPQEQWLRAELAANTKQCTLAMWHHPLWTSTQGRNTNTAMRPLWDALYEYGADLIVNGHDHVYERFAPMRPDGTPDATFGLRQITVGLGGAGTYNFGGIGPNSEVRDNSTLGVIKLTLSATGYTWQLIPVPGGTFTDAGSGTCHGRPGGGPPPNQAPTANPGGPYAADANVTFNGTGSSDPDNNLPLTYAWTFGDGTTGSGVSPTKTYTTNGTYTATLVVTDALGLASAPASTSVTIANVAPAVNAGADASLVLGAAFQLGASFTDPGAPADAPWGWTIAWGDGTTQSGSAASPGAISASYTYAAAGTYAAQVSVTDKDGDTGSDQATVTVLAAPPPNQPPTARPGGPYAADAIVSFNGGTSSDPDNNLPLTYAWTFGDGTTGNGVSPAKTYTTNGTYTATLVVTDALGLASAPASTSVTIANVAPAVDAGADASLVLGAAFQLSASFTDPGAAADSPWGWTIAWGDGTTQSGSAANPGGISASHSYTAAGPYTMQVSVTDKDGGTGSDQATVTVLAAPPPNQPPTARPGGPYAADAIVSFNGGTSSDPDNNLPLTYAWTFGDGATGGGVTPSHTYAAAGSYPVTLIVTDALGLASASAATSATIANVVPSVSAGADAGVLLGAPFNLSATFTDPGSATDAPWAWTIAWGDGASAAGSTSVLGGPIAASHTYAAPGAYSVQVTVTDKDGGAGADGAVVTVTDPPASVVLVGAGNITRCDYPDDEKTALLLDGIAGTVFTTGDNVRASGSLTDFQSCYDPTWGRQKARTRPAAGDLDYQTAGAAGYFSYFGAAAGAAGQGYYSYDLGAWHIIVLNSNISMAVGSAQEVWLKADLAANARQCVLAYWHHPRFSSYSTAVRPEVKPLWDALYAAGADVVLNGHYRLYERFAPQTPAEVRDDATGIRQFTVGTGGHGVEPFGTPRPNSEVRSSGTFGVLQLTLRATGYDWQFVPVAGQTFTDAGTTACH
jgi:PKD repeat protein